MKLEERLNEIIEEKDETIDDLEREVEKLKREMDISRLSWQMHTAFQNDDFYKHLPYPRLEMRLNRLSKDDWYSIEWIYGLVYKHATDVNENTLLFVPLGRTTSSGGKATFDNWTTQGKLQLPFRDGLHIYAESLVLNLPAFIVCKEMGQWNKIEDEGWSLGDTIPKMKNDPIYKCE